MSQARGTLLPSPARDGPCRLTLSRRLPVPRRGCSIAASSRSLSRPKLLPLVRQAIGDPESLPDRNALISVRSTLEKQPEAPHDLLSGVLLLRTGKAREAILLLRAALRNRGADGPPVEELLLALTHAQRNQPDEARKLLKTPVTWMERGSEPVRGASGVGLISGGPLNALAGLALNPPDHRLDGNSGHELTTLRAEVENALAKQKPKQR